MVLYVDTLLKFPAIGCIILVLLCTIWKEWTSSARLRILCMTEMIIWLLLMAWSFAWVTNRIGSFNDCVIHESVGGVPPQDPSLKCTSILRNGIVGHLVAVKYFTSPDKLTYYVVIDALPYVRMHWTSRDQHWEILD